MDTHTCWKQCLLTCKNLHSLALWMQFRRPASSIGWKKWIAIERESTDFMLSTWLDEDDIPKSWELPRKNIWNREKKSNHSHQRQNSSEESQKLDWFINFNYMASRRSIEIVILFYILLNQAWLCVWILYIDIFKRQRFTLNSFWSNLIYPQVNTCSDLLDRFTWGSTK